MIGNRWFSLTAGGYFYFACLDRSGIFRNIVCYLLSALDLSLLLFLPSNQTSNEANDIQIHTASAGNPSRIPGAWTPAGRQLSAMSGTDGRLCESL